jgi:hypothetical protein
LIVYKCPETDKKIFQYGIGRRSISQGVERATEQEEEISVTEDRLELACGFAHAAAAD